MNKRLLPAYPLFVKDPNYSIWSCTDALNDSAPKTWWGEDKPVFGLLRTHGKTYCFLGDAAALKAHGAIKAEQTSLGVTSFTTDYEFKMGDAKLKISFVSPLPPDDLELLDMPVCYMEYELSGCDDAELSLFVNRRIAYNYAPDNTEKKVRGGVMKLDGFENAFFGRDRQLLLSNNNDLIGADWGYFHLAGESAFILDGDDLARYVESGDTEFRNEAEDTYIGVVCKNKRGAVMLGYDDVVSIDYFGRMLKGYYLNDHTIVEALEYMHKNRADINKKLDKFDKKLVEASSKFGDGYTLVLYASLRQSIAAHKLVKDPDGNVLFLSKECGSNGCIATVDVSYPSIPLYLAYNPELVKGMMRPILEFARMPVWEYDFAPHDVGTYPSCCGQAYALPRNKTGGKYLGTMAKHGMTDGMPNTHLPYYLLPAGTDLYDFDSQMPVEECANMLVMFLACYRYDNDIKFFADNIDLAEKWVEYLVKYGLKPENQLCTDDFAGHLKNNVNLAVKATVGIAAYAELAGRIGKADVQKKYRAVAEQYAAEIEKFGSAFKHIPITWDSDDGTFSLKYNIAFDKIFKLGLFKQETMERELDCYLGKMNKYGVPLDNRENYTKTDWMLWAARLTDRPEKRKPIIDGIVAFLQNTEDRVPFSDWYYTETGKFCGFRARSVQGGCFILLL